MKVVSFIGLGHVVGASDTIRQPPLEIAMNSHGNLQGEREVPLGADSLYRSLWSWFLSLKTFHDQPILSNGTLEINLSLLSLSFPRSFAWKYFLRQFNPSKLPATSATKRPAPGSPINDDRTSFARPCYRTRAPLSRTARLFSAPLGRDLISNAKRFTRSRTGEPAREEDENGSPAI